MTYTATYSPEDNKLRLYASARLDAETYARVKEAGFIWAPKQELFVAPAWTPGREDLLLELAGEIGDEDTSLVDRAEQRAERFEDYKEARAEDANRAHAAVKSIADNIPFGQPILVGHHSERRARKDAERIENGMRRAIKMWDTAQYWKSRAAGAIAHAKYKELPGVRHRRIKSIEADLRKQEREKDRCLRFLRQWNEEGITLARALQITNSGECYISRCFPLSDYPRNPPASQYEGQMGLWSALDGGVITAEQAKEIAIPIYQRGIERANRWIQHYQNRLEYERAMLNEQGGTAATKYDLQIGGRVYAYDEWLVILRLNKDTSGEVSSVTTNSPRHFHASKFVIEVSKILDYKPPEPGDSEKKVKAATKLPPMCNYPVDGCIEMTQAQWNAKPSDYKGSQVIEATETTARHRVRRMFGYGYKISQVFITDAKRVDPPKLQAAKPAEPVSFARDLGATIDDLLEAGDDGEDDEEDNEDV